MALSKQLIPIPLGSGVDTKTDARRTPVGKLVACENAVFSKTGALHKRHGYDAVSLAVEGGGAISGLVGCVAHRDELLAFTDQGTCYSRSAATERWVSRGEAVVASVDDHAVVRNAAEQRAPDVAYVAGLRVVVWEEHSGNPATYQGIKYSVYDDTTGTVLVSSGTVASSAGTRPRVVAFGDYAVIIYADGVELKERHLNAVSSPTTLSTAVAIVGDVAAGAAVFDAAVVGSRLWVVWNSTVHVSLDALYLDSALTASATIVGSGAIDCTTCVCITSNNVQQIHCVGSGAGGVEFLRLSYTGSVLAISDTVTTGWTRVTAVADDGNDSTTRVVYEVAAGVYAASITPAGVVGAGTLLAKAATLASHAWVYGSASGRYVVINWSSTEQSSYFAINASTGRVVARVSYGNAGGARPHFTLSGAVSVAEGRYAFARQQVTELVTTSSITTTRAGITVSDIVHEPTVRLQAARAGDGLVIAGGVPQYYDGLTVRELGFLLYPEGVTGAPVGGGGSMSAGTYQYSIVYEGTDNLGQFHRSAPSTPIQVTTILNDSVTLTVPNLRIGAWGTAARLVVYRTAVNGSVFYRVSSTAAPTQNDPTTNTTSITDTASDASITSNELLYTTGGVIENVTPSSCKYAITVRGRVWLAGFADGNVLAYSKALRDGEPPAFSDLLTTSCDPDGGPITGLGAIDDKVIVFKRDRILALNGPGPSDTGIGAYDQPMAVTTEQGCSSAPSIVTVPEGCMFQSPGGIYLLDRSLQTQYVGAPVEDWNDETVVGAARATDATRVVFWTAAGPALVYDWQYQQWATWTAHEATSATVWRGLLAFVDDGGRLLVQNNAFTDAGSFVRLRAVFGWMALGGIQGFERLYRARILGEMRGPHTLRCRFGYDYDPAWKDEATIDAGALYPGATYGETTPYGGDSVYGGSYPLYRFEFRPERQKVQAFRVAIEDVQTSAYNEGVSLVDLSVWVGLKRGPQRLPSSNTAGAQ